MPSDSNLPGLPDSPLRPDDLWLINRDEKSYKVTTFDLGLALLQIEIPKACDTDNDCDPGYECVDGVCHRLDCDIDKYPNSGGCPPGFHCYGGYCWPTCSLDGTGGGTCGEGTICVDFPDGGPPICVPYPFPCIGGNCPPGFVCFEGNCYQLCSNSPGAPSYPCPDGTECVQLDTGISICVPTPYPCGEFPIAGGNECPVNHICYNGQCVELCSGTGQGTCDPGFECTDIGSGISVCLPEPTEGFVNDGPLIIRTDGVDDGPIESIIFTANQYGRSVMFLEGFTQIPGEPGGGSGGDLHIIVDPNWWIDNGLVLWEESPVGSKKVRPIRQDQNVIPHGTASLGLDGFRWNEIHVRDTIISRKLTFIEGPFVSGNPTWDQEGRQYDKTPEKFGAYGGVLPYLPNSHTEQKGVVELATWEETKEGVRDDVAVTPFGLRGGGVVPKGGIIMWSGEINTIPDNWALCDGRTVGGVTTPDLTDKFVMPAGGRWGPHEIGGNHNATVPVHNHSDTFGVSYTDPGHVHDNGDYEIIVDDPTHGHLYTQANMRGSFAANGEGAGGAFENIHAEDGTSKNEPTGIECELQGNSGSSPAGISVSFHGSNIATGSPHTDLNIPKFYALAYIMRLI